MPPGRRIARRTSRRASSAMHPDSEILGLFIESLNDVIDIQKVRVVTNESLHLPSVFWVLLIAITVLSFLLVGIAGSADGHRNYLALAVFALAFAAAIVLLFDLDNPQSELLEFG